MKSGRWAKLSRHGQALKSLPKCGIAYAQKRAKVPGWRVIETRPRTADELEAAAKAGETISIIGGEDSLFAAMEREKAEKRRGPTPEEVAQARFENQLKGTLAGIDASEEQLGSFVSFTDDEAEQVKALY